MVARDDARQRILINGRWLDMSGRVEEGGIWCVDPQNTRNAVRVMPGNPNSPHQNSRVPYVRWQRNGQALDAAGNVVPSKSPGAHIPLEDFCFNPDLFQ